VILQGGKRFAPTGSALNQACQRAGAGTFGFKRAPLREGKGMGAICLIIRTWALPRIKSSRAADIPHNSRSNFAEIASPYGREWMDWIASEC